jgi:hypothetical protein
MQLLQNRPSKWNHRWQHRQIDDNQRKTLAPKYHSSRQLDLQVRETNEYTTSMGTANTSSIAPSTNIKTERERTLQHQPLPTVRIRQHKPTFNRWWSNTKS